MTPEERLVLLDFGLAAELSGEGAYVSTDANVVGTAAYMSPEQAASGDITQASDWYAVGVVLYEALTGRLPFTGKPLKILIRKSQRDPPPPQTLVADVPDDLNQLCCDLLRRDPKTRPEVEEILRRAAVTQSSIWARSMAAFRSPDKTPLVGRDRHLAEMDACYAEMERGQAVVLFVHGQVGHRQDGAGPGGPGALAAAAAGGRLGGTVLRAGIRALQGAGQPD